MKKIILPILLFSSVFKSNAQALDKFTFGLQVSPGWTIAHIKDDDPKPSSQNLSSDGYTTVEENGLKGYNIKLIANYELNDQFDLSSGIYFGKRKLNVRNDDGNYIGTSLYQVGYVNLPILLRYKRKEIANNLYFTANLGPTIDFSTSEKAIGSDFAHFKNFAQNRFDIDQQRGRNGNSKSVDLFAGTGISVIGGAGLEYELNEMFRLGLGLGYHHRLTNSLNGKLLFNDSNKTKITETTKWSASLLSIDFGVIVDL